MLLFTYRAYIYIYIKAEPYTIIIIVVIIYTYRAYIYVKRCCYVVVMSVKNTEPYMVSARKCRNGAEPREKKVYENPVNQSMNQ